jgi:hypothetical protein
MSAAPLLAALFARGFPGLAVRDLGLPAGRLLPWLPGVRAGVADAAALPAAERALLARFRQRGRPLLGLDPVVDAAPDAAWDAAADRLACQGACGASHDATLTLLHGGLREAPLPPGLSRIMLLVGSPAQAEPHDLLVPEARLAETLERLRDAAAGLAGEGWRIGGRLVSPRLASLGVLAPGFGGHASLPAEGLPHDLPAAVRRSGVDRGGIDLGGIGRLRLLLGALPAGPWRLRLGFGGAEPGAVALFVDGGRQPVRVERDGWLAATIESGHDRALVLGLAWPVGGAPDGLHLATVEVTA